MARFAFLDWPGPIAFAHRGGASDAPENTMAAFEHAVRSGYRYVETDAHLTADGVLLAFHDHRLDRVTDRTGVIAELPWSEVARARVDGREPIPRLEELLTTWPELRVNIDPKHDAAAGPLAEAILRCNAVDRVCVGSFSDRRIAAVKAVVGDRLCTSSGPREVTRLVAASRGVPLRRLRAACVQVPPRRGRVALVTSRFLRAAHRRGMPVHVWTIDDRIEMERLLDLGVDGIMTDRLAVLRDVLEQRGRWHE